MRDTSGRVVTILTGLLAMLIGLFCVLLVAPATTDPLVTACGLGLIIAGIVLFMVAQAIN